MSKTVDSSGTVSYYFPEWLLMRAVSFVISRNTLGGLKRCLEVRRAVTIHADILRLASIGEIRTIKVLFEKHLASPIDVCCSDGRSVLHVSVFQRQSIVYPQIIATCHDILVSIFGISISLIC